MSLETVVGGGITLLKMFEGAVGRLTLLCLWRISKLAREYSSVNERRSVNGIKRAAAAGENESNAIDNGEKCGDGV